MNAPGAEPSASPRPDFRPARREKAAPCGGGCPNGADIRGWLAPLAQREALGLGREEALERAWRTLVERNPLPATLGRICPHPCEASCNRTLLEGAVQINRLERFLGDWALERGLSLPAGPPAGTHAASGRTGSVAVVGAGPAGLSAAYQLVRRGHAVTVFEGAPEPGGMLRWAIPSFRLPPAVLRAEIERVVALGVEIRTSCRVGRDVTVDELLSGYDATFLGLGAQRPRTLEVDGAGPWGLLPGTDYLHAVKEGADPHLGARVVVVGGGNTAVDAARTARRAGSTVVLAYRRTREEMPAFPPEVDAMLSEGVELRCLVAPLRLEAPEGGPAVLVLGSMRPGEPDAGGRRRPVPIPGAETRVGCDAVVTAVAQEVDWTGLEPFRPASGPLRADPVGWVADAGVWAGGDVLGAGLASRAVGEGRRAAAAIHARLVGGGLPESREDAPPRADAPQVVQLSAYEGRPPLPLDGLDRGPDGGAWEPDLERVALEAGRCLSCGLCFGCRRCWMYCSSGCFEPEPRTEPGRHFTLDLASCEACGKCVDVCPCGYLEFASASGVAASSSGPAIVSTR